MNNLTNPLIIGFISALVIFLWLLTISIFMEYQAYLNEKCAKPNHEDFGIIILTSLLTAFYIYLLTT